MTSILGKWIERKDFLSHHPFVVPKNIYGTPSLFETLNILRNRTGLRPLHTQKNGVVRTMYGRKQVGVLYLFRSQEPKIVNSLDITKTDRLKTQTLNRGT